MVFQDYIKKIHSSKTKNEGRTFEVEVTLKNQSGTFWYDLIGEQAIQWTLSLVKAFRDQKKVEVHINQQTNEVLQMVIMSD